MRIAVDARELGGQPTGVGRYLTELLAAWRELPGAAAHEFIPIAPEPGQSSGTLWEQRELPRLVEAAGADVLFAPGYTGPLRGTVPMVVAIHDVSFAAHPEWFGWREGLRRRMVARLSARRAARVLTISDFSKREIVKWLHVPASKVEVTYLGVTRLQTTAAARQPTVLFVGSLFNRRHPAELIGGFDRMAQRHPQARLELVGDNRTRPHIDVAELIASTSARDRIRVRPYVSDRELSALYSTASAFVFLSDYEGFALTPLEALSAGAPVVLLDTEVAREIYGPAASYVERPDPELIAAALERALFDAEERARVLAAAPAQLDRYSWRECAQRTLQVLLASAAPA